MDINQRIIDYSAQCRPSIKLAYPRKIVIHNAGCTQKGVNAECLSRSLVNYNNAAIARAIQIDAVQHANFLEMGKPNEEQKLTPVPTQPESKSWHFSVDETSIYQTLPTDEVAWNAGDGHTVGGGNMSGISIEICDNIDGDMTQAMRNAAWLTAKYLKEDGSDISRVKQHFDFSGKDCPYEIRHQGRWQEFLDMVSVELGNAVAPIEKGEVNMKNYILLEDMNMRASASPISKIVGHLSATCIVTVTQVVATWGKINFMGVDGWVSIKPQYASEYSAPVDPTPIAVPTPVIADNKDKQISDLTAQLAVAIAVSTQQNSEIVALRDRLKSIINLATV